MTEAALSTGGTLHRGCEPYPESGSSMDRVGDRTQETARLFLKDLATRVNRDVQLTSDGFPAYVQAVLEAFGLDMAVGPWRVFAGAQPR